MSIRLVLAVAAGLLSRIGSAHAVQLQAPVACTPHCQVAAYVDHQGHDYRGGTQTYPGCGNTDIRAPVGTPVHAAAAGVVIATRDGEPDHPGRFATIRDPHAPGAAGNFVMLRHQDGTLTVYGHLRQGSLQVEIGDRVTISSKLAEVGQSGAADFPHIALGVMRNGHIIDPLPTHMITLN